MAAIIPAGQGASVLFVGNSFTHCNDLPACVARLAAANGRELETAMATKGGERLSRHAA